MGDHGQRQQHGQDEHQRTRSAATERCHTAGPVRRATRRGGPRRGHWSVPAGQVAEHRAEVGPGPCCPDPAEALVVLLRAEPTLGVVLAQLGCCLTALGVALFPTTPELGATARDNLVGAVHLACAAGLLLTLAYFSLRLFRLMGPNPTPQKLQRNRVYAACGYTILACVALCVVVKLLPGNAFLLRFSPLFWLEAVAVVAFGVSWLTKGEAILADK